MTRTIVTRTINAPIDVVFKTVSDIRELAKPLPHVVKYEFLTDVECGLGTRFRETRNMNGKEAVTELEVTEYVDNEHVRMVADSHGAIWDTVFAVAEESEQTRLTLTMDARPYQMMPRLMIPLFNRKIQKSVEHDMDLVKEYCERE